MTLQTQDLQTQGWSGAGTAKTIPSRIRTSVSRYLLIATSRGLDARAIKNSGLLCFVPVGLLASQIVVFPRLGFTTPPGTLWFALAASILFGCLSQWLLRRFDMPTLGHFLASFGQIIFINTALLGVTYMAAVSDFPMQDEAFARMDSFLGFDWPSMARTLTADLDVSRALAYAYSMFDKQLLIVPVIGCIALRFREIHVFTLAWVMTCLFVTLLAALWPAYGASYHFGMIEELKGRVFVLSGFGHIQYLDALRSGIPINPFEKPIGLITFPSFHAAGAVIFIWFFWHIMFIRWPMLIINTAMIVATPLNGAHYLVDVLAGLVIGFLGIWGSCRVLGYSSEKKQEVFST